MVRLCCRRVPPGQIGLHIWPHLNEVFRQLTRNNRRRASIVLDQNAADDSGTSDPELRLKVGYLLLSGPVGNADD